ncbi:hypothetical protein [Aquimarina sp. AU474]|uniref:hypothetical protein n=1 Tax=Aquimarina sp. AU474 TaxID=2108529 RepID=UPI000D68758E|nr:hypothetical protein [Aquimarina sp. AU474]
MKKARGKKLSLQKLSVAKLNNMNAIQGGRKSRRPSCYKCEEDDILAYSQGLDCQTRVGANCTTPTIIQL